MNANPGIHVTAQDQGVILVEFDSELFDRLRVEQFAKCLQAHLQRQPAPRVLISFARIREVSSAILGVLIHIHKDLEQRGGRLRLVEMSPKIHEVFQAMKLDHVLAIDATREQALTALYQA